MAPAAEAQKAAEKALNNEHYTVLNKLQDSDVYKEALAKQEKASADLKAAHDDPDDADPAQTATLAAAVMDATQAKSKLESQALATDPDYAAAQAKLDAANKTLGDLKSQEQSAMQQDPDWSKAHQDLVSAQTAYDKLMGKRAILIATGVANAGKSSSRP